MNADKQVQGRARWRVAIVDDHERSRSALRAAIWSAGGEVVGESVRCADALVVVRRNAPDVAICAAGLPDGDGVQTAAELTAANCPVVLFTSHTDEALVERAPALDLAIARFAETRQLKQTLEDRKVIERAKGALMARLGLTEDDAFKRLRRAAMDSRKPMVEVARALLVSESVIS